MIFAVAQGEPFSCAKGLPLILLMLCAINCGCKSVPKRSVPCDVCLDAAIDSTAHTEIAAPDGLATMPSAQVASFPITSTLPASPSATEDLESGYHDLSAPAADFVAVADISMERRSENLAPSISGTHLGTAQITATEHALRLKQENEQLRSSQESLLADNQRLKDQLEDKEDLFDQIGIAMSKAQLELEKAAQENQRLKYEISKLQRQQQRGQQATERMLESIRGELDDVLMREMTAEQN